MELPSASGIDTPVASLPPLAVYPNPFNPQTTLHFTAAHAGPVRLDIYDLQGRLVRSLIDERVAAGEPLPFTQDQIVPRGAAIECRINAEDCENSFRPCPGKITHLLAPGGLGVRFDSHVHVGYEVSPYYDSMIGKLFVHQADRLRTIACMRRALAEMEIGGVKTTAPLQLKILEHTDFVDARVDTTFIERTWPN